MQEHHRLSVRSCNKKQNRGKFLNVIHKTTILLGVVTNSRFSAQAADLFAFDICHSCIDVVYLIKQHIHRYTGFELFYIRI